MSRTIVLASILSALLGSCVLTSQALASAPSDAQAAQQSASNPNVPGATGRTIVEGDRSTIAGDAKATRMQQTGAYGGG
jgi:hypothetical protein